MKRYNKLTAALITLVFLVTLLPACDFGKKVLEEALTEEQQETVKEFLFGKWELVRVDGGNPELDWPAEGIEIEQEDECSVYATHGEWSIELKYQERQELALYFQAPCTIFSGEDAVFLLDTGNAGWDTEPSWEPTSDNYVRIGM